MKTTWTLLMAALFLVMVPMQGLASAHEGRDFRNQHRQSSSVDHRGRSAEHGRHRLDHGFARHDQGLHRGHKHRLHYRGYRDDHCRDRRVVYRTPYLVSAPGIVFRIDW